jgi:hypothetical protein
MRWIVQSVLALAALATPAFAESWHVATESRPGGGVVIGIALVAVLRRQGRLR